MGEIEPNVMLACRRQGLELPQDIQNAPELALGLEIYYEAFVELNTCRSIGMCMGPVQWDSILKYANEYGFQGFQREALFYHTRALDRAYLRYNKEQAK